MAYPRTYRVLVTVEEVSYDDLGRQADSREIDAQQVFQSESCAVAKGVMDDCAITTMAALLVRREGRWLRELALAVTLTARWCAGLDRRTSLQDRKTWLRWNVAPSTLVIR